MYTCETVKNIKGMSLNFEPLLFFIYLNDVAENMSFYRLFADDNSVQHAWQNLNEIEFTLNHDLSV